jgi:hypothetical protein
MVEPAGHSEGFFEEIQGGMEALARLDTIADAIRYVTTLSQGLRRRRRRRFVFRHYGA